MYSDLSALFWDDRARRCFVLSHIALVCCMTLLNFFCFVVNTPLHVCINESACMRVAYSQHTCGSGFSPPPGGKLVFYIVCLYVVAELHHC